VQHPNKLPEQYHLNRPRMPLGDLIQKVNAMAQVQAVMISRRPAEGYVYQAREYARVVIGYANKANNGHIVVIWKYRRCSRETAMIQGKM